MGKSRSRQHQGIPEPLDESKFPKKRKTEDDYETDARGFKRKKAAPKAKPVTKSNVKPQKNGKSKEVPKAAVANPAKKEVEKVTKRLFAADSDEEDDGIMDDEFEGFGSEDSGDGDITTKLGDDFLDDGSLDDEVYDSDDANQTRPIFFGGRGRV
jgi:hypothetical protein